MPSAIASTNGARAAKQPTDIMQPPLNSSLLHRDIKWEAPKATRARGSWIDLSDGRKILDATGGAAVACIGHGDERVARAVADQTQQLSYCHTYFVTTESAENLAHLLIDSTNGKMERAFIASSGSEAMEGAIKMARQYFLELSPAQPQRTHFISRQESYHGATLGALAVGGHRGRRALFEPLLSDNSSRVSACNEYRNKRKDESTDQFVVRLAQELDDEFKRVGPDTVCAFVAEPVVGAALGCVPAAPGYFRAMKAICDKYGALLILDEVMCGMGRTGTVHAWEQEDVVPDIQTLGKGLGGGYAPVAAILMGHRVFNAFEIGTGAFMHGQTYQGHPASCAAAAAVQRVIREDGLLKNVQEMGKLLSSLLHIRLDNHPHVGNIRGRGLFWGIEFVRDKTTKEPFAKEEAIAMGVHKKGMEEAYCISLYPGTGTVDGVHGDHVLLAPAYNTTREEIELIVDLTTRVVNDFFVEKERLQAKST